MNAGTGKVVGLFGGSFNPPHAAHQLIALYCLETQPIDEIWFVPVYTHVFGKDLAAFADRVAMTELAIEPLGPRARVYLAEEELAQQPGFVGSRTLDLIEHLVAHHPGSSFRLIVGTDILAETAKWHRWADVVAAAPLIVVGRTGHAVPPGSTVTGLTMPEVSSTAIRAVLAGAGDASSLLPASVLRYIAERDLYS
ncbi:MAG: nicotinate (nicotinamide) nucleotide adenylyltransferase [Deltaproteobacteria bacterium]|nr:nicotinate (nicotinamide) nucleotide adenylyltransferase [Deltaproteobacteria bacterium]